MSADGWVFTCGCGNEVSVKNAGVVCSTDGCDHCRATIAHEEGFDPLDYRIGHELGWCGCGNPERIDELMAAYLGQDDADNLLTASDDTTLLVAYIADQRGWTEHGGSISYAWLTDEGRETLANLRLFLTEAKP